MKLLRLILRSKQEQKEELTDFEIDKKLGNRDDKE